MSTTYEDLGLTNFPDSLDTFLTYLNITATDAPLIAQYQSAVESGDFTTAQNVLAQIPSYTQKLVKATDLNKIMQSILALERFFKTDIQSFVNQKQTEWEEIVGEFDYKGVYSSGTTYTANNVVTYTAGGLSMLYIATGNPPVGTSPSNTNYWRVLTIRGQQGPSGTGFSYRQAWQSNVNYVVNNAVSYDNILWGAIADSINQTPSIGSTYWKPILQFASTKYPIQPDEPASQDVGDLWFNTTGTPEGIVELNPLSNPANAENILLNAEAYDDQGNLITGSMVNNRAVNKTLALGGSYTIPQGYHNGQGKVNGPSLPTLSNPATADIIPAGYETVDGEGNLLAGTGAGLGNATTADVASGKTFTSKDGLNVVGTLVQKEIVSGTATPTNDGSRSLTIPNLSNYQNAVIVFNPTTAGGISAVGFTSIIKRNGIYEAYVNSSSNYTYKETVNVSGNTINNTESNFHACYDTYSYWLWN